jgi:sugar (pentulose or hexulose) kinase
MTQSYFIGIDIGTQGARVVLLDHKGKQLAAREDVFAMTTWQHETQSPQQWWRSCYSLLQSVCVALVTEIDLSRVKAITVTSTSGTIIPLNKNNEPLHEAIMYSDTRSAEQAIRCREAALASGYKGYTGFNSSAGLPKMLWFMENHPEKMANLGRFIHAADFITGKLSGNFSVTDHTDALKSGFDARTLEWPAYLFNALPLQRQWLQDAVPSGKPVGIIEKELAKELNLSPQVIVTAGLTDGCASQVASGAVNAGDWNTTIGTTLVIKGVTKKEIIDPSGALYCHRHPEGYWMPGGASNTGADWVNRLFDPARTDELNAAAPQLIPTGKPAWPLMQDGERFPFVAPQARGFAPAEIKETELFAAYLEGVAYIERYAYEKIMELSGEKVEQVFAAGGGSHSDTWLLIRSSVLGLPIRKMKNVSGAAGAAIVAASQTHYHSLTAAAQAMTEPEKSIQPQIRLVDAYEKHYHRFINTLKEKGYIPQQ